MIISLQELNHLDNTEAKMERNLTTGMLICNISFIAVASMSFLLLGIGRLIDYGLVAGETYGIFLELSDSESNQSY